MALTTDDESESSNDMQGLVQLTTDAVRHTTRLVETVHSRLDWVSARLFPSLEPDRMGGIAGRVYQSIHVVNDSVGVALQTAVSQISPLLRQTPSNPEPAKTRETMRSVLNGVVGDYLQATSNPLAIDQMTIRVHGIPQTDAMLLDQLRDGRPLVLLIHGSCMNDLSWKSNHHDHGALLAQALDACPLYLHYNTGLHVSENGKLLARQLDRLAGLQQQATDRVSKNWHVVTHSMGGLVMRSACHYAQADASYNSQGWLEKCTKIVFLGTPHHGAILERGGKWVDYLLSIHPYTEPFSWIGKIRSHGVMDLGYGHVREEDWMQQADAKHPRDNRLPTPLPLNVKCLSIAAVKTNGKSMVHVIMGEDGLVSEQSALGRHVRPEMNLHMTRKTIYNTTHVGLLSSQQVLEEMYAFLKEG